MIQIFKYTNLFFFSYYIIPLLTLISITGLCIGLFLGLITVPIDFQQGLNYKIIFIHVPSSCVCMLIYLIMVTFAILYLIYKIQVFYYISFILCKLGLTFTFITLITGAFWGKPLWGTFWVWDARLTSVFILFVIYLSIYFLNVLYSDNEKGMKYSSFFVIFGFLNIPIIKYSVDWWSTLHQTASLSVSQTTGLHHSVFVALMFIFLSLLILGVIYVLLELKIKFLNLKSNSID